MSWENPFRNSLRIALALSLLCAAVALAGCRVSTSPSASRIERSGTPDSPQGSPTPSATVRPLDLSPGGTSDLTLGKTIYFTAMGGIPPYRFAATAGEIDDTGEYRAPYYPATVTVTVQDSRSASAQALVLVSAGSEVLPNDPMFSFQKGLSQAIDADIDAPEAWALHQDCQDVLVAVLDSGTDIKHPDLAANIWTNPKESFADGVDNDGNGFIDDRHGWSFVDDSSDVMDENLHGTHVAGIIGAVGNNGEGISGVCWNASIATIKFLDADGAGFTSDAIAGIDYAVGIGAKVINASFGGGSYNQLLKDAIDRANAAGALFIAAAGNESSDNDSDAFYPGNYASPNILSVAATTALDQLASFSNYGPTHVHIAAPGSAIQSTLPTYQTPAMTDEGVARNYGLLSGTSMAAPMVAGAAALLWSFEPTLTHLEVRSRLLNRADALPSLSAWVGGARRLNLRKALYAP